MASHFVNGFRCPSTVFPLRPYALQKPTTPHRLHVCFPGVEHFDHIMLHLGVEDIRTVSNRRVFNGGGGKAEMAMSWNKHVSHGVHWSKPTKTCFSWWLFVQNQQKERTPRKRQTQISIYRMGLFSYDWMLRTDGYLRRRTGC